MHFKSIFSASMALFPFKFQIKCFTSEWNTFFGEKYSCQVYSMLMKLRAHFDKHKKVNVHNRVLTLEWKHGKYKHIPVHSSAVWFICWSFFFIRFEALLTVCYHIMTVFFPLRYNILVSSMSHVLSLAKRSFFRVMKIEKHRLDS